MDNVKPYKASHLNEQPAKTALPLTSSFDSLWSVEVGLSGTSPCRWKKPEKKQLPVKWVKKSHCQGSLLRSVAYHHRQNHCWTESIDGELNWFWHMHIGWGTLGVILQNRLYWMTLSGSSAICSILCVWVGFIIDRWRWSPVNESSHLHILESALCPKSLSCETAPHKSKSCWLVRLFQGCRPLGPPAGNACPSAGRLHPLGGGNYTRKAVISSS